MEDFKQKLGLKNDTYNKSKEQKEEKLEGKDLEEALQTLQRAFVKGILELLGVLDDELPRLDKAMAILKTSTPYIDLIKPLWFYQGDNLSAYKDYLKATEQDNAEAYLELGKMALEGIVLPQMLPIAREYFIKATKLGSIRALTELGLSYLKAIETKEEEARQAWDYLKKALILGDVAAYVGMEKIEHLYDTEEIGEDLKEEMHAFNAALMKNPNCERHAVSYMHFNFIKDPKKETDLETRIRLAGVQGECLYTHYWSEGQYIDEDEGMYGGFRGFIDNHIEEPRDSDLGEWGLNYHCGQVWGVDARSYLGMLKCIKKVYGFTTYTQHKRVYKGAKESYEAGIDCGDGKCALELGQLYLDILKWEKEQNVLKNKDIAALEAKHHAIACFKKALQLHHTQAIAPLTQLLEEQKELLDKLKAYPKHADLSAQYTNDFKEAKAFVKVFGDALIANDQGQLTPIEFGFSKSFFENTDLPEPKKEQGPKVKPLWQYGKNTKQAFKDYMEAKDQGSASAWLELGKMSLQGIVVEPDPIGAMICFEKASQLGSLQAEVGKAVASEYAEQDYKPDYNDPIKGTDFNEKNPSIFNMKEPLEGIYWDDLYGGLSPWMAYQGEGRGMWGKNTDDLDQEGFENVMGVLEAQAHHGDIPVRAWWGLFHISAGFMGDAGERWDLEKGNDTVRKNLVRMHANMAYKNIQMAIEKGYVDGYYFLGGEKFLTDEWRYSEDICGLLGFWQALRGVRKEQILDVLDSDEFEGEYYGDEEDYIEGLAPEDPEDAGTEFYNEKIKESLKKGVEAGSALCAIALVAFEQEEIKHLKEEGEGLEACALFDKRHAWIELLKPIWEEQRYYRAYLKLLELWEAQIAFCEREGFDFKNKLKEDIKEEELEAFKRYRQYIKDRPISHAHKEEMMHSLREYYDYNSGHECLLF